MTIRPAAYLTPLFLTSTALADVPNVVTDFAPIEAVVSRVMEGVGAPQSILSPGDDPHHFAMRPSHARTLSDADIVIWTGAAMTPWLDGPIANLSGSAVTLELLATEGWEPLEQRGEHSHDHDDHGHDDDTHDDHSDHDGHDDHDHDEAALAVDPHAWLDPAIVAVWAREIAETLAAADADNAETYRANATAFAADIDTLTTEIAGIVAEVDGDALIFSHDASQYFEAAFGVAPVDYIAASDAAESGPAHLRALRDLVESGSVTCVFSDAEVNPGTINTLIEGTDAGTAYLDLTNAAGTDYPTMIRRLATTIATCSN